MIVGAKGPQISAEAKGDTRDAFCAFSAKKAFICSIWRIFYG